MEIQQPAETTCALIPHPVGPPQDQMSFKSPFQPKPLCDPVILAISKQNPLSVVRSQRVPVLLIHRNHQAVEPDLCAHCVQAGPTSSQPWLAETTDTLQPGG